MDRIVILGGGVGGTLTANLLVKQARARQMTTARGDDHASSTRPASTPTSPASCTSPWAASGPSHLSAAGARRCSIRGSTWSSATSIKVDPVQQTVAPQVAARRLPYDELVIATGSPHRARGDRALRHRGPSLLHRRGGRWSCATRSTRSPAAGSSSASPACPTSARRHRWRWPSSSRPSCASATCASAPSCTSAPPSAAPSPSSRSARWSPRSWPRRASSCTRSSTSNASTPTARSWRASRARSCGYDLLILVPPHTGQPFLIDSGLAQRAGRVAADRPGDPPGRRPAAHPRPR